MFKISNIVLIRGALAAVWLYQGVWCKVLRREARHRAIVEAAGMGWVLLPVGWAEAVLAVWVIVGWHAVLAAGVQTALIVAMNVGGLCRGRNLIADPAGMVLQNVTFLMLAWVAAGVLHAR
jgi:hypothetical protein